MSVSELVRELIAAGTDPAIAADVVARAAIAGAAMSAPARSAGAIRQERYRRNKASQVTCSDEGDAPSSLKSFPEPLQNNPSPSTPPSPPKGGSSPIDGQILDEAVEAYNAIAAEAGWPKVQRLTDQRRGALRRRLTECGGLDGWHAAMAKARGSPFLTGDNNRGWRPDFDFFMQAKSFTKLMEGGYDQRDRHPRQLTAGTRGPSGAGACISAMGDILAELADAGPSAAATGAVRSDRGSEGAGSGGVIWLDRGPGAGFG